MQLVVVVRRPTRAGTPARATGPSRSCSSRIVASTPRSLVRFAARAAAPSTGAGSSSPSSDHVPAREDRGVVVDDRRGREGRRGVVPGDGAHERRAVDAVVRRAAGRASCPGSTSAAEQARPAGPSRSIEPARPRRRCARRAGRWCVAAVASLASSPLSQKASRSGTSASAPRASSAARALVGEQLEDGVDRHRLDAGRPRRARSRGTRSKRARDHARRARVAVVERQAEHAAAVVEQAVVDAPGVDADAVDAARAARSPSSDLGEQRERRSSAGRRAARTGRLGKRWTTSSSTRPSSKRADDDAAALRAEVGRGEARRVRQGGRPPRGARARVRRARGIEERRHLGLPARVDLGRVHRALRGLEVVGLDVADQQPVLAQEQRVVAPAGLAQRVEHLRPDRAVARPVLLEPIGPDPQLEADALHLSPPRRSARSSSDATRAQLAGAVADAERDVVGRALGAPALEELGGRRREAQAGVRVADPERRRRGSTRPRRRSSLSAPVGGLRDADDRDRPVADLELDAQAGAALAVVELQRAQRRALLRRSRRAPGRRGP